MGRTTLLIALLFTAHPVAAATPPKLEAGAPAGQSPLVRQGFAGSILTHAAR